MKRQLIVLDLVHRSPFAGRVQSSGPTNRNQIVLVLVPTSQGLRRGQPLGVFFTPGQGAPKRSDGGVMLEGLVRGSPFTGQSNVKRASSAVAL